MNIVFKFRLCSIGLFCGDHTILILSVKVLVRIWWQGKYSKSGPVDKITGKDFSHLWQCVDIGEGSFGGKTWKIPSPCAHTTHSPSTHPLKAIYKNNNTFTAYTASTRRVAYIAIYLHTNTAIWLELFTIVILLFGFMDFRKAKWETPIGFIRFTAVFHVGNIVCKQTIPAGLLCS